MPYLINIIGAGRLGTTLALALQTRPGIQLGGVCNQQLASAKQVVQQLQSGIAVASLSELPAADMTFITTPDDQIAAIAEALSHHPNLSAGHIIAHCSGAHPSTLLTPLKSRGCHLASIHPFNTFTTPRTDAFHDCYCTIEGDEEAVMLLSTIFGQLGAKMVSLPTEQKYLYHAAATMASNYMVTLASSATAMLTGSGIAPTQAKHMCEHLMQQTLHNIQHQEAVGDALTGPLMRRDVATIRHHLQALKCPLTDTLYRAAGLATLPLIKASDSILVELSNLLKHQ